MSFDWTVMSYRVFGTRPSIKYLVAKGADSFDLEKPPPVTFTLYLIPAQHGWWIMSKFMAALPGDDLTSNDWHA